jgi:hypothetical protein
MVLKDFRRTKTSAAVSGLIVLTPTLTGLGEGQNSTLGFYSSRLVIGSKAQDAGTRSVMSRVWWVLSSIWLLLGFISLPLAP